MAINLTKGQRIDLTKTSGSSLTNFCVGVNWGSIDKIVTKTRKIGGILGLGGRTESYAEQESISVDLDLSCILINSNNQMVDYIYSPAYNIKLLEQYGLPKGKLVTTDGAMRHSGDDREGDKGGDDGLDNEIITVDLSVLHSSVSQIFFFLNNVGQEDFSQIPYAKIRMYEGSPTRVDNTFASYNVSAEPRFSGKKSLIMGKLYKKDSEWKFHAIGDPTEDGYLGQTIHRILKSYL